MSTQVVDCTPIGCVDIDDAGVLEAHRLLTGGEATAHAMRQIDPDVVPVYPITPQTPIIQAFSQMVADGEASGSVINVESEHSAMSAAIGSATSGARTMTATASQGMALMVENVYIAASMRLPIVMAVGNRALSGPINIHCDHSDGMLARDSGFIQLYVESAQEAYDFMVIAPRIAEHPDVLLPVMVGQDGFTITHTAEPVELLEDDVVKRFVGEYRIPHPLLDLDQVTTQGPFDMPDYYFEHKRAQHDAMANALSVAGDVVTEFAEMSGRSYDLVESYRLDDAERAIVAIGSSCGTVKDTVDEMREAGERVGLLEIRLFRPFPHDAVASALDGVNRVAVLDRAMSFGSYGPLYSEVASALFGSDSCLRNYVYGLGGRDLLPRHVRQVFAEMELFDEPTGEMRFIGVRE